MTEISELVKNATEFKKNRLSTQKARSVRIEHLPFADQGNITTRGYAGLLERLEHKAQMVIRGYNPKTHGLSAYGSFAESPLRRREITGSKTYASLNKPPQPRIVINDEESYIIPDYPRLGPRP